MITHPPLPVNLTLGDYYLVTTTTEPFSYIVNMFNTYKPVSKRVWHFSRFILVWKCYAMKEGTHLHSTTDRLFNFGKLTSDALHASKETNLLTYTCTPLSFSRDHTAGCLCD